MHERDLGARGSHSGQLLGDQDPAAAAGDDDPQQPIRVGAVEALEQAAISVAERLEIEVEVDRRRGDAEPLEVLVEPEGMAAVELDRLEGAVAAEQPVVEDRDRRLARGEDLPVDADRDRLGHVPQATGGTGGSGAGRWG